MSRSTVMRPLKVTCVLASPLAGEPPHLDSLLEFAVGRQKLAIEQSSNGHRHEGMREFRPGTIPIPVRRVRVAGYPHLLPLCSDPIMAAPASDQADYYCSRVEVDPAELRMTELRQLDTQAGRHKSYRLPLRVRVIDRIVWFAFGVGVQVRYRLRRFVPAVGKKTAIGYGRVAEWIVEHIEEDLSWFAPHPDGQVLMRILPASIALPKDLIGYRRGRAAPVSPYWMAENQCDVVMPC